MYLQCKVRILHLEPSRHLKLIMLLFVYMQIQCVRSTEYQQKSQNQIYQTISPVSGVSIPLTVT